MLYRLTDHAHLISNESRILAVFKNGRHIRDYKFWSSQESTSQQWIFCLYIIHRNRRRSTRQNTHRQSLTVSKLLSISTLQNEGFQQQYYDSNCTFCNDDTASEASGTLFFCNEFETNTCQFEIGGNNHGIQMDDDAGWTSTRSALEQFLGAWIFVLLSHVSHSLLDCLFELIHI